MSVTHFYNPEPNTIFFAIKPEFYDDNNAKLKNNKKSISQKLFLMSKFSELQLFKVIPKDFSISTKNTTCHFNKFLLENTSSVISEVVKKDRSKNSFFLNIIDEENALRKFEQLYQGEAVVFDEDEIPSSQQITKILMIKNCPNFLKPKSLQSRRDVYFDGLSDYSHERYTNDSKMTVQIFFKWFIGYLKKEEKLLTFSISTKKKEYKCNFFGIYSSNILRQILDNDSTITSFNYDFDDESDEFQLICDLFNFKQVDITNKNMYILKKIAEDLQISCIIKQIDTFISSNEKISEKVKEQKIIIDSINNLFDLLYNVKKYGIQNVKESILQSKWIQKVDNVKELGAFIIQVIKGSFSLHQEMADLLIQLNEEANESNKLNELMPFVVKILMHYYFKGKTFFYNSNISLDVLTDIENAENIYAIQFIYILYKKGIIPKEKIVEKLKNSNYRNKYLYSYFLSELIELNPKKFKNQLELCITKNENIMKLIDNYLPDKIDQYTKMIENMEPSDELTKSLRKDDVDKLKSIIENVEFDVSDEYVPYNIFDDFPEPITLINYAAYCGSINCFKYLLSNNRKIDNSTYYFAVYGNNIEIIKIVESTKIDDTNLTEKHMKTDNSIGFQFKYNNVKKADNSIRRKYINDASVNCLNYSNDNTIISTAIIMHRNELFDWIFEKRFINKGKFGNELNEIALISAINGNAHSLIEIINKGFNIDMKLILKAAKNGFYQLPLLLLNMINQKEKIVALHSSFFGNLSIFELFFNELSIDGLHKSIFYAIIMDNKEIIDYFFDKASYSITNSFVKQSLIDSLQNNELFDFLMEKYKKIKPTAFKNNTLKDLLCHACYYSNLHATKILTELVLIKNPDYDFSNEFVEAANSNEICRYFIDKKVNLNYEQISLNAPNLASLDLDLFLLILEKVNKTYKKNLMEIVKFAIQKKNKKLIEFLLKENMPQKSELIDAVCTHDLDIVDCVLKYNKSPSFINYDKGKALIIASKINDLDIVKRIISLPGIDPTLYDDTGATVLSTAIVNNNSKIIDEIVNFFGNDENIQKNISFFYKSFRLLSKNNDNKDCGYFNFYLQSIIRIFELTSIDPNYYKTYTFFYIACQYNNIEAVERFLKLKNIDVNKCEIYKYNTPLMIAIQMKNIKIAKLLIQYPKTNLNLKNLNNESAITIAISQNLKGIVDIIIKDERFDPIESNFNFGLFNANSEMIKYLSTLSFIDVNYVYIKTINNKNQEITALVHSVYINDVDKIDFIINHPSFDKDKSNIKEAIFAAAETNNVNIFRKLIKLSNNYINMSNNKRNSLLSVASFKLSGAIINEILNNPQFDSKKSQICDAFVHSYDELGNLGNNYRISAPWNKHVKKKLLLKHDEDYKINWIQNPSLKNNPNWQMKEDIMNIDSLPQKNTKVEIMNILYNYDKENLHLINFNELLSNGKSFFSSICLDYEDIDKVCQFLLDHGVDPNKEDEKGIYPLLTAIGLQSNKFVDTLLNSADIDFSQIGKKTTYLHVAAGFSNNSIFQSLLNTNAFDVNAKDINGDTPLIIACKARKSVIIELLFKQDNLDYLHCNNDGIDALNIIHKKSPSENNDARKSKKDYQNHLRLNSTGTATYSILNDNGVFSFENRNDDD